MNTKKILFGILSAGLLLASCNINKLPSFSDDDAFISFTKTSALIDENSADSVVLEVLCTSLKGKNCSALIEIVDSAANMAKRGVNFTYYTTCGSDTLNFSKENTSQYIIIKPIDNDEFGGDKRFGINLKYIDSNIGFDKTCTVTIADNEHPLAAILGTYNVSGVEYWDGPVSYELAITKDEQDLSKVWIYPLLGAAGQPVYGIVNEEKTEIKIPVLQTIGYGSSYPYSLLMGFYGPDGDIDIEDSGSITAEIAADGTITIVDWFGIYVYSDPDFSSELGWGSMMTSPVVLTK